MNLQRTIILLTQFISFDITDTFKSIVRAYSFGFGLANHHGKIPYDERVGQTISKILDDFFLINDDIILYIPLDIDGREKERLRLFDIWWACNKRYFLCENLVKDRIEFKYEDDKDFIVTIFFKESQRQHALEILYGSLPEVWDESK